MARKINVKLILELREAKLSRNQIADSRHIARNSVSDVFRIADERGITYSDIRSLTEAEAYCMFYPDKHAVENIYSPPDYEKVHEELKGVGVTLGLLWDEYQSKCKAEGTLPVGRTKFYEGYQDFVVSKSLTNHIEHKPGERVEVDWSGKTMSYVVRETGEIVPVHLFVGTLPYSQYSYVEDCQDMKMDAFLRCHIHMYGYFEFGIQTEPVETDLMMRIVNNRPLCDGFIQNNDNFMVYYMRVDQLAEAVDSFNNIGFSAGTGAPPKIDYQLADKYYGQLFGFTNEGQYRILADQYESQCKKLIKYIGSLGI